jgi:signal transduction histidine kinase
VGDAPELLQRFEKRQFFQVFSSWFIISLSAAVSLMALLIGGVSRNNHLLIFGVGSMAWALRTSFMVVEHARVDYRLLLFSFDVLLAIGVMCLLLTVVYAFKIKQFFIKKILFAYLGAAIFLSMGFALGVPYARSIFLIATLAVVLMVFGYYVRSFIKASVKPSSSLLCAFGVAIIFGFYDQVMVYQYRSGYELLSLSKFSYLIVSLSLSIFFGFKLFKLNALLKSSHQRLNERLVQARFRLDAQHTEQTKLLKAQTLLEERWRIMQDMHDGLGGQLISLQKNTADPTINRAELTEQVADALNNVRMTIHALGQTYTRVSFLLGDLRERLEALCNKFDKTLVWQVDETPDLERDAVLRLRHLEKILMELFTNIAKHSNATQVKLSASMRGESQICIRIEENGQGFDAANSGNHSPLDLHKGLSGLKQRADIAKITLLRTERGTVTELILGL